jgi:hypothetical protein
VLESRIAGVADWLVDFQNIYRSDGKHGTPDEMRDFEGNVSRLPGLDAAERRRVTDKMCRVVDSFPELPETFVTNHFLPRNLMFVDNDSKICGVDFAKVANGWPLYDFLTFMLGIEKLELYPFITRVDCEKLKEIFISEYSRKANIAYDEELIENLWATYVIADLRRRYQRQRGIRLKGFGNSLFAYKTVRRLAEWSNR